jgi:hypothetical protein
VRNNNTTIIFTPERQIYLFRECSWYDMPKGQVTKRNLTPEARAAMGVNKGKKASEKTRELLRARTRNTGSSLARWAWMASACSRLDFRLERDATYWRIWYQLENIKVFERVNDVMAYLQSVADERKIPLPEQPPMAKTGTRPVKKPPRWNGREYIQLEMKASTRDAIRERAQAAGMPMTRYLEWLFEGEHTSSIEENIFLEV